LSQHDLIAAVAKIAPLPCDAAGPVFAEPWQAQAFAMVIALHAKGLFTWTEWAAALSHEVKAHGMADDGSRYYEFWLEALEHIAIAKGVSTHQGIDDVAAAWARAAEATPHGKPIELGNDPLGAQLARI
jgi:nitrile hydratase accessory protein